MSCSEPPEGFARWSLRLLADQVVELDCIGSISHEAVRRVLKKKRRRHGRNSETTKMRRLIGNSLPGMSG